MFGITEMAYRSELNKIKRKREIVRSAQIWRQDTLMAGKGKKKKGGSW